MPEAPLLELHNVDFSIDGHAILKNISLDLPAGALLALNGPSGAGKSTLLRLIAGLLDLRGGSILMDGRLMADSRRSVDPADRGIGISFQDGALFPHLNCADNILFGFKAPKAVRMARLAELLRLVSLYGFEKRYPHQLSGGQQQRVALARALAKKPRLLLLDEAFAGLDTTLKQALLPALRHQLQAGNISMVMVSHDPLDAGMLADSYIMMNGGTVQSTVPNESLSSSCRQFQETTV
jgi:iron(III) transport system ATP-binding protein